MRDDYPRTSTRLPQPAPADAGWFHLGQPAAGDTPRRHAADVCLILEGTYPYLVGGVSAWVQGLLTGLPDLSFAIVHLSAEIARPRPARYPLPPNLVAFVEWPLDLDAVEKDGVEASGIHMPAAGEGQDGDRHRIILPQARVYHALSTGFAGVLGCQVKAASGRPLVLTEHGIYWREAEVGTGELECGFRVGRAREDGLILEPLRRHWTATLQRLARQTYRDADIITTVCWANRRWQLALGALPARSHVIPNGVDWRRLSPPHARRPAADGLFRIGFVGRVVPLKDVLTFLHACRRLADALPRCRFYVIGPLDHDATYASRCRALAQKLGLASRVTFTGVTDPAAWYHRLDVVVLTSLREGQPLALLEAMAAGTPVVATDVGGCPELVLGTTEEDRALGASGLLTPTQDPDATAGAVLALCRDPDRWQSASQAGQERVRAYYALDSMCEAYRRLYTRWL